MTDYAAANLDSEVFPLVGLGCFARIEAGGTPKDEPQYWNGEIPFITPPDLNSLDGKIVSKTQRNLTLLGAKHGSKIVDTGVIISCRAPVGHVGQVNELAAFNQGCKVIQTDQDQRFISYCFVASRECMQIRANGTTFFEISSSSLYDMKIPLPPLETQCRIADYLDKEISEMDAMIEEFEGLVRNLRARKPMLIDKLLAGFPVAPLALSWKVVDCLHITAPFVDSGENYLVSIEQLGSEDLILDSANRTDGDTFSKMREGERKPCPGDVIMSRNASVGKSSIVKESDPPIALGQDVVIFKNNEKNDSRLLYYFLQSNALKRTVDMNTVGSTLKRINVSSIKTLPYPVLDLEAQQLIAEQLRRETAKMDALIEESTRLIENLKARKTALITEVVTGRKEV